MALSRAMRVAPEAADKKASTQLRWLWRPIQDAALLRETNRWRHSAGLEGRSGSCFNEGIHPAEPSAAADSGSCILGGFRRWGSAGQGGLTGSCIYEEIQQR